VRGFGVAVGALGVLFGTGCTGDQEVLAACQDMSEHRRDCGFTDDGVWCQEMASYKLSEVERDEVFCILDCHREVGCDDIALEVCAPDRFEGTPANDCAQACRQQSDLLFVPPRPAECDDAPTQ
jgi:hypothetical protein